MKLLLSLFFLLVLATYCGAQDRRHLSSAPPQYRYVPEQHYQEFVDVVKRDWALTFEVGTPAERVLAYQPAKNPSVVNEHYRWMMYRPSDYIDSLRPKPSSQLITYTVPH